MSGELSTQVQENADATIAGEVGPLNENQPLLVDSRPRVTLKYAQTLDGRIATSSGHSRWISSEQSRVLAHQLRAEHDAVLVGVGTVLADDPSLNVRLAPGDDPLRVVADSTLRTPPMATILRERPESTLIATSSRAPEDREKAISALGARVLRLPERNGQVDLAVLLQQLDAMGLRSVLVEGGASIVTSFLRLRLVDHVVVFIAPKILGAGIEAIGDLDIRTMDDALTFRQHSLEPLGRDIVFRGEILWPEPPHPQPLPLQGGGEPSDFSPSPLEGEGAGG